MDVKKRSHFVIVERIHWSSVTKTAVFYRLATELLWFVK